QRAVRVTELTDLATEFVKNPFEDTAGYRVVGKSQVPVGLRYGLGRTARKIWETDSCAGLPWGSLLVGKFSRPCGLWYQDLEYRGVGDDPPDGSPVAVIPNCLAISDPLDATPTCIN